MQYKTRGIIIKRVNIGEADRILTVFTERRGKIKIIAKGVRKTLSKLAGHLEPFCLTDLVIAEGKTFDVVTAAQVQKCYLAIRENLDYTNFSYFFGEIIDKMMPEGERHTDVFALAEETFDHLNAGPSDLLTAYFIINFLSLAGFKPQLNQCGNCEKEIEPGKNYFGFDSGGLICGDCSKNQIPISDEAIKVLRLFIKHDLSVIGRIKTDKKLVKEVSVLAGQYLSYVSEKEFKSERYLVK